MAPALARVDVVGRVLVALWTVRLEPVGRPTLAASDVLRVRDRLKVVRIDARTIAAEMVEGQAFRNWTYEKLVGDSVRSTNLAVNADATVAIYVSPRRPFPTAVRSILIDLRPEACFERDIAKPAKPAVLSLDEGDAHELRPWRRRLNRLRWLTRRFTPELPWERALPGRLAMARW